jgi:hypothetical protein
MMLSDQFRERPYDSGKGIEDKDEWREQTGCL